MIVADEMDADWGRVRSVQADAHPRKYGRQRTVGSGSVRGAAWMSLRQAGAAAREMLVAAAAVSWEVGTAECRTLSGRVIHDPTGRTVEYGDLVTAAAKLPVPKKPRLKNPAEFTLIGTDVPQVDTRPQGHRAGDIRRGRPRSGDAVRHGRETGCLGRFVERCC